MNAQTYPFRYIPPELVKNAFVAGGFAVDAERASDIDLWITGCDKEFMRTGVYETDVLTWLNKVYPAQPWQFSAPADSYDIGGAKRLGVLHNPFYIDNDDTPIQILACEHSAIIDLLESFDLSVHQVAYNCNGTVYTSESRTHPGITPIRVTRWDTPHSTLRRYFKLSERYDSAIEWADIEELARLVNHPEYKGKWPGKKLA